MNFREWYSRIYLYDCIRDYVIIWYSNTIKRVITIITILTIFIIMFFCVQLIDKSKFFPISQVKSSRVESNHHRHISKMNQLFIKLLRFNECRLIGWVRWTLNELEPSLINWILYIERDLKVISQLDREEQQNDTANWLNVYYFFSFVELLDDLKLLICCFLFVTDSNIKYKI